ncbi:hypothetical protein V865_000297 [Kwoniella europaea PYCC6329]|uniref:Uncharacterized protein n=1 Tax=Kwoniella europaea PYCC6329 TaxID=1423913 RepID=A0AAX4K7X3_9TREE
MPALSDTLESLSSRTSELAYLTTLNSRPAGKFTQAYLNLPSSSRGYGGGKSGNVLELIRDSNDGERRLFKFVGESNSLGDGSGGGGNKRVEKRENVLVTPLKQLKSHVGGKGKSTEGGGLGRDEVEIVLRTAMKLVDDYRPMPRARAHIANLLDSHHSSQERLIELERLIEEASKPISTPSPSTSTSTTAKPSPTPESSSSSTADQPKLTPEEAIKAEEASLRALEASLIPLRKSSQANQSDSPPPSTRQLPSSPPPTTTMQVQTPAKPAFGIPTQTPAREMPHVTNSLVVNGMTPRRIDRFSPLKLITPREPLGPSGLGDSQSAAGAGGGRRSIFGRASIIGTHRVTSGSGSGTGPLGASTSGPFSTPYNKTISEAEVRNQEQQPERAGPGLEEKEEQDETIRIPRPASPPTLAPVIDTPSTPAKPQEEPQVDDTPKPGGAEKISEGEGGLAGIDLNNKNVKAGMAKIWSTLGEMMRQGMKDGQTVNEDVESSIKHLIHLSSSDLPSPPSPSSSSISSLSTAPNLSKPITSETILFSHLILSILKQPDGVDMNELKEHLGSIAKARNFDGASSNSTKIIYAAVGKRMVRIDRKGGMVKVKFAD